LVDLRGVDDDAQQINRVMVQEAPHHLFVLRKTVQIVQAGQINHFDHLCTQQNFGTKQINGNAGPVANAGAGLHKPI